MSDQPAPDLRHLGDFDPLEAKHLLPALEAAGIPFELEADHHELQRPWRTQEVFLGMYPEGSKFRVYVPAAHHPAAFEIARHWFPT